MRRFKKLTISILAILLLIEITLLGIDTHNYLKYKYAKLNINGRIICELDNMINFSGFNIKQNRD